MYPYTRSSGRAGQNTTPPESASPRSTSQRDLLSDRGSDFESLTLSDKASVTGQERAGVTAEMTERDQKERAKICQIAQKFFTKGALTIVSSRVELPHTFTRGSNQIRVNKWFNLVLPHSDMLEEDVHEWAALNMTSEQPRPLLIEICLDVAELGRDKTLVIADDRGTKWDVCKALGTSRNSNNGKGKSKSAQIVLERWKLHLKRTNVSGEAELLASTVYKHSLVMFRALYTYLRSLPAWKLGRRTAKEPANLNSLKPSYRVVSEEALHDGQDLLAANLHPSSDPTTVKHVFAPTKTPLGSFCAEVTYRAKCDFYVADTDSLLSSQFRVMDNQRFGPSVGSMDDTRKKDYFDHKDVSSLPSHWRSTGSKSSVPAPGSLATSNEVGPGTSPRTTRRANAEPVSSSPPVATQIKSPPDHRALHSSKSSLKTINEVQQPVKDPRRTSVSFAGQSPFKAGSLASSPLFQPKSSPKAVDKIETLPDTRKRNSLTTTLPQAALRIPSGASTDVAAASPSSSLSKPPMVRYSSSFGNRRASRLSSGGGSRGSGDDTLVSSSVRGSQSSSNPPDSGVLAGSPSPGSLPNDDDQLADFIKLLDQKKDLRSLNRTDAASKDASTRKTTAALNKYKSLRESQMALADSLSSSTMMHRSSSSSSRVPALVAGSSLSSVSPGAPKSPHTPHTPAIPSRLSSAAIAEDFEDGPDSPVHSEHSDHDPAGSAMQSEQATAAGSRPIDVPMSPQRRLRSRRSSSVKLRGLADATDFDDYTSRRTASVPVRERGETKRAPLKEGSTALEGQNDGAAEKGSSKSLLTTELAKASVPSSSTTNDSLRPTSSAQRPGRGLMHSSSGESGSGRSGRYSFSMSRHYSGGGRGGTGAASEGRRGGDGGAGGVGGSVEEDEPEEPLLFTMSELEAKQARGV